MPEKENAEEAAATRGGASTQKKAETAAAAVAAKKAAAGTGAVAGTAGGEIARWRQRFRQELVVAGYSPRTLQMYTCYVDEFLGFFKKNPENALREDVIAFLAEKKEKSNAGNATLALAHAALHFFFHNVVNRKIVDEIKTPKKAKKLPIVLARDEVRALIAAAKSKRNRLVVQFLYSSGCRVSECVRLQVENINFKERIADIRGGKGNKDRVVVLSKEWLRGIKRYLARKKVKTPFVFSKKNGKPLSADTVQRIVQSAAKKAGIQKHVTPHTLRHSYATHLLEAGENIRKIQELLGHNSLNTTQIYTQVSLGELKKVRNPLDTL
ncbi:MAG: tyrosine-type recombinase/integrase [Candidatus Diapherotrites archaeon]|nr:tyrosine-type recombinase/integrase [Candidatus Diapherotrites archaeon]